MRSDEEERLARTIVVRNVYSSILQKKVCMIVVAYRKQNTSRLGTVCEVTVSGARSLDVTPGTNLAPQISFLMLKFDGKNIYTPFLA